MSVGGVLCGGGRGSAVEQRVSLVTNSRCLIVGRYRESDLDEMPLPDQHTYSALNTCALDGDSASEPFTHLGHAHQMRDRPAASDTANERFDSGKFTAIARTS